jgi:cytidylate kinase
MNHTISPEHLTEALARAHRHWQERRRDMPASNASSLTAFSPTAFTIAVSRETGTYGAAIAREVANRLGWPLYDRELLQRIADDMGVRGTLLESVDERQVGWVSECLGSLFAVPGVNQFAYVRQLVETLLSLAVHGKCVIVGRGASVVLPRATTLRVRLIAPLDYRIDAVQREQSITFKEAAARVESTDRERNRFVRDHFQTDPLDPANYDLILNAARFSAGECADLVIAALDRMRKHLIANAPGHVARPSAG